ncbi:hypothetical protein IFM89_003998 [Coptis chinensis]|uniref:Myb/SANT-like domain-containing protein n=1 Tax=Coptis chinensis TaxID=261450 RepID=A0A835GU05_9MAGN|nr:hypothetical protein IFM89_003998 [Coptis chinensis]
MANKVPKVKSEKEKKQISWAFSMDAAIIETFLDAYRQNKKHGRVWDEAVYASVQLAVLAKTQEQVEKAHITSLMRKMRKEYNSFTDLASRSGFGWDLIKHTITAPPSAWIELLSDSFYPSKVKNIPLFGFLFWSVYILQRKQRKKEFMAELAVKQPREEEEVENGVSAIMGVENKESSNCMSSVISEWFSEIS